MYKVLLLTWTMQLLHLPHSGLALHNSHAPLPPHLHARTPLCLRKGSSPFLAWPLQNDTIKQTCSSACFSMAAASPSTCHAVLCLSVHCRAWLRLGLASSLSPTTLCVAVCWTRCAMGTLLQQNLVLFAEHRRACHSSACVVFCQRAQLEHIQLHTQQSS